MLRTFWTLLLIGWIWRLLSVLYSLELFNFLLVDCYFSEGFVEHTFSGALLAALTWRILIHIEHAFMFFQHFEHARTTLFFWKLHTLRFLHGLWRYFTLGRLWRIVLRFQHFRLVNCGLFTICKWKFCLCLLIAFGLAFIWFTSCLVVGMRSQNID